MPKKQALFPIAYDEISLVDSGGGAADDGSIAPAVLIMKRESSSVQKLNSRQTPPTKPIPPRKPRKPKSSGGSVPQPKPLQISVKEPKKKNNPCDPKSSTGAKTGKSSQRAKNWQEGKHPRQQGGKFGQTSQASKKKYGKGGTTKAKQVAECKRRHSRGKGKYIPQNARAANARGLKSANKAARAGSAGGSVTKNWKTDAQLRALVERKATR
jgi:hypothetical protein